MTLRPLCTLEELEETGSRGVAGGDAGLPWDLFVVRRDDLIKAYRNNCPHTGAPLDWMPHRFLDLDGELIQCSIHGALFRVDDGVCLRGPCVDSKLEEVPIQVRDGAVWLNLD